MDVEIDAVSKMGVVIRTGLTIPEIVAGAMDFTTLAGALRAAGLEDKLKADGPFTLLAPDNDAFAAMPEGYRVEVIGGERYYTYNNPYYRPRGDGYVLVDPPVQAIDDRRPCYATSGIYRRSFR